MPDRRDLDAPDELPLEPLIWTRRRTLAAGLAAAGVVALRPIAGVATAGPRPATILPTPTGTLDRQITELMVAGRIPGLSVAVIRGHELRWSKGYGYANLLRGDPVGRDTLFMLASISKTFIATALMQAVEDGLFGLDDDVNDILPFPVHTPQHPMRAITVRQLLTHTSSIRDRWSVWDDLYADGDSPIGLGEFLQGYLVPGGEDYRMSNFFDAKPGAVYRYSNIGASLAAFLVEVASGAGFDAWCDIRIFGPLGMTRAGWHLADVPGEDVAMPYRWSERRGRYVGFGQYGYPDYPDGALRTTAPQLARHLGMMMNRGRWQGTALLERGTVREILHSQIPDVAFGQGLIWYRTRTSRRLVIGHNGGDQGVATVAFFDPAEDIGVVALANGNWRRVEGRWPLQQIMNLLFDRATSL
jgi:CubicO group peptidase (beta-lactamase class C family)